MRMNEPLLHNKSQLLFFIQQFSLLYCNTKSLCQLPLAKGKNSLEFNRRYDDDDTSMKCVSGCVSLLPLLRQRNVLTQKLTQNTKDFKISDRMGQEKKTTKRQKELEDVDIGRLSSGSISLKST